MKRYKELQKAMARRMVVSVALAGLLPLSARHDIRVETATQAPRGTEHITVHTDSVPAPDRARV